MGSGRVSKGEGIRGRPAVAPERQGATVNRERSRSGSIEPSKADAEDEECKGVRRVEGRRKAKRVYESNRRNRLQRAEVPHGERKQRRDGQVRTAERKAAQKAAVGRRTPSVGSA